MNDQTQRTQGAATHFTNDKKHDPDVRFAIFITHVQIVAAVHTRCFPQTILRKNMNTIEYNIKHQYQTSTSTPTSTSTSIKNPTTVYI